MTTANGTLHLRTIAGPERVTHDLAPGSTHRIGRSLESEICLLHQHVSRKHASIADHNGHWYITDLESRHGTTLNSVRLESNRPGQLAHDDRLQIGPWHFRVDLRGDTGTMIETIDDQVHPFLIRQLDDRDMGAIAQQRLDLIIDCSARINAVPEEDELAEIVLSNALAGSGFARAAWIEPLDAESQVEIRAVKSRYGTREEVEEATRISRSVIRQAQSGHIVRLASGDVPHSHSIAELGIHTALCAPIKIDDVVAAYLYLDARGHEAEVRPDAAPFCQALARMCGLALANLKRTDLVRRQRVLDAELAAAREAQQIILPKPSGTVGRIEYASSVRPGMIVAGDLFNIIPLDERHTAVSIGDVTGEGIGAALIMASAQAMLHSALMQTGDPLEASVAVNAYLVEHSPVDRFVSMLVAVIDHEERTMTWVDAGHGHWLLLPIGMWPAQRVGGIPLGIESPFPYDAGCAPFPEGARMLLLSDGVLEQRNADGTQFGWWRVWDAVQSSNDVRSDVSNVFEALYEFADGDVLDDDATVASVAWA